MVVCVACVCVCGCVRVCVCVCVCVQRGECPYPIMKKISGFSNVELRCSFTWYVFLPDEHTPKCASATGQEASIHCTCGKFPGVDSSHPAYYGKQQTFFYSNFIVTTCWYGKAMNTT